MGVGVKSRMAARIGGRLGGDRLAGLFSGVTGYAFAPSDPYTVLYQERTGASATTLAGVGDPVGTVYCRRTGNYLIAGSDTTRMTVGQDANGFKYLQADTTDDALYCTTINLASQTFDTGLSYDAAPQLFMALSSNGDPNSWVGIGQNGSAATILSSGCTLNAQYFDNVLSANTTRGQNYTSGQAAETMLFNATSGVTAWNPLIGAYVGGSFFLPGRLYSAILRVGTMNASQRAQWHAWASSFVTV